MMSLLLAIMLANATAAYVPEPGEWEHPATFESDCKVAFRLMTASDPDAAFEGASASDSAASSRCVHYVTGVTDAIMSARGATGKDAVQTHNGAICTGSRTTTLGDVIHTIVARGAIKADTCVGCATHRFAVVTAAMQSIAPCP